MLSFQNVGFSYADDRNVLDGLDLEIGSGELVALVGANGTGKTTVTRLATALEHPHSGTVNVCGLNTAGLSPEDLADRVAYLFQHVDQQLFARSVEDEVRFGPRNLGCSVGDIRQRTEEALERVGLTQEANTHPFDLSPANRKLVGLASGLAQKPGLLILDEPTQGMDWSHVSLVAKIVREEAGKGCSVLAVTHDLNFVAEALERVVWLEGGKVEADLTVIDAVSDRAVNQKLGLSMPPVAELSVALGLPGTPIRFSEAVNAIRTVAVDRPPL